MIVRTKTYEPMAFNKQEILRYAGVKGDIPEINELVDECIKECGDSFFYKVCYTEFDVCIDADVIDLGFLKTKSQDLRKNLSGCKGIILFGATVGLEIDRLIARYSVTSPAKSLLFQAIGAERIESLCDRFNYEIKLSKDTVPRFSAGYGDFPIEAQRDIFSALDCERKIGLTLNNSLLMSPSKSVTAIIGVK